MAGQVMKAALADAFKRLLSKRTIDKITVKDVVAECGVNRQTFYYHFKDIYDLMEWILFRDLNAFLPEGYLLHFQWKDDIRCLYRFLLENRKLILHAYDAVNRTQYQRFIRTWIRPIFAKLIEDLAKDIPVAEEKKDFVINVYTWACTGLAIDWIEAGLPDEYQVHLEDYFTLFDGSIESALRKFWEEPGAE